MRSVPLGELFELKYGKALRKDRRLQGEIPVYGSNGRVDYHNESLVKEPTIVVGRKGSIGEVHLVSTPSWPIDTTYFVHSLGKYKYDLEWLYRLLKTLRLQDFNRAAAVPGLNRDDVYRIKISLPPIDDQKRIAHLLGKVEGLIAQRKQHLQQLDDLLKSTFLEMFGPRAAGYATWPLVEIKHLAANHKGAMRTGPFGSNLLHSEFASEGDVAVLGIDNAVQNRFAWGERRFITIEKFQELENYRIYPGDVIVTIMGTIGRSAVIPHDIPIAINTKHLAAITLNKEIANPLFVSYSIHSNPFILNQFKSKNRGAIMSGLNLGLIKETKLKRPPIELQNQFAATHKRIDAVKFRYQQSLADLECLYGALSKKAFKGELDLSRVLVQPTAEDLEIKEYAPSIRVDTVKDQQQAINLPDVENMVQEITTFDGCRRIIRHWLEAYAEQIKGAEFCVNDFFTAAQLRMAELLPENDFEIGLSEYEHLKDWVFASLDDGRLRQSRNSIGQDEKGGPIWGNRVILQGRTQS